MCVRIAFTPLPAAEVWNPDTRLITIPTSIPPGRRTDAVRAVLAELAVPQPKFGAVCYCGQPIDLLSRIPEQRRSDQVVGHGA